MNVKDNIDVIHTGGNDCDKFATVVTIMSRSCFVYGLFSEVPNGENKRGTKGEQNKCCKIVTLL